MSKHGVDKAVEVGLRKLPPKYEGHSIVAAFRRALENQRA